MTGENQIIYDSGPTEPDDLFWLRQGEKLLKGSPSAILGAAKSIMTALTLLQTIYLGILGFSGYIPPAMSLARKAAFFVPLLLWLWSLYHCLCVMMTKSYTINRHSPDDIRDTFNSILISKQHSLRCSFLLLSAGLLAALLLIIFRPAF
jgi:hypothetical protein